MWQDHHHNCCCYHYEFFLCPSFFSDLMELNFKKKKKTGGWKMMRDWIENENQSTLHLKYQLRSPFVGGMSWILIQPFNGLIMCGFTHHEIRSLLTALTKLPASLASSCSSSILSDGWCFGDGSRGLCPVLWRHLVLEDLTKRPVSVICSYEIPPPGGSSA